jgi:hypothetical protein
LGHQLEWSETELLERASTISERTDNQDAKLIKNKEENVDNAEHSSLLRLTEEELDIVVDEPDLQHQWEVVGTTGQALRRSKRKQSGKEKKFKIEKAKSSKFRLQVVTSTNNSTTTTTKTTTNNRSTLQINKSIIKNNKNLTRIKNKEQKSQEELKQDGKVGSPMLLNLDKAITRAKELLINKNCESTVSRDPKHKSEAGVAGKESKIQVNSDAESDSSALSINSKKSYVSMVSSRSKNSANADMFDKKHEDEIAAQLQKQLQLQQ